MRSALSRSRRYRVAPLVVAAAFVARSAPAQSLGTDGISGAFSVMQPLTSKMPGTMAGWLLVDPSTRAIAPWASLGLRWDGLLDRDARLVGGVGLRWQSRTLLVTLGMRQDVAYGSVVRSASAPPPSDSIAMRMTNRMANLPVSLTAAGDSGGTGALTRAGYAAQPVTDVIGTAEWSVWRVAASLQSGWRVAGPGSGRAWINASVATPLLSRLAFVAAVNHRRDQPFMTHAPRVTLGFEWRSVPWRRAKRVAADTAAPAPAPAQFSVFRTTDALRLRFVAPQASTVEIRGNLTQWSAVALASAGDGVWSAELPVEPGLHRLALRVDGGPWVPPPGLETGSDGYGATVGIVVVDP